MAQTKRKRQTKHRGNAAGVIEARGRTGRPPSAAEKKQASREQRREERLSRKPTLKGSAQRALLAGGFMFLFLLVTDHSSTGSRLLNAFVFAIVAICLYVGIGYYFELFLWRRRMARKQTTPDR